MSDANTWIADRVDVSQLDGFEELVGESRAMQELRERIGAVAQVHSTVLICGETGTGKSAVARAIHATSERRAGPFVHVDCAALAPGRSASDGFEPHWRGHFEQAAGGAIFLDEVGELDPVAQSKLLRVLEEPLYPRVGGETLGLTARVLASTSRDPLALVDAERIRPELFFRLNVIRLDIPPLRERLSDLPQLVAAALRRLAALLGVPLPRVTESFYERLFQHDWPGNVRELSNVLERALVRAGGGSPLDAEFVERALEGAAPRRRERGRANTAQANQISAVLRATGGNVSRAARRLGLARSTLRYRIRLHELSHLIPHD